MCFVGNLFELREKLKHHTVALNPKLLPSDVTRMFSKIPPQVSLPLIRNFLEKKNTQSGIILNINTLFKIYPVRDYFVFENKYVLHCK